MEFISLNRCDVPFKTFIKLFLCFANSRVKHREMVSLMEQRNYFIQKLLIKYQNGPKKNLHQFIPSKWKYANIICIFPDAVWSVDESKNVLYFLCCPHIFLPYEFSWHAVIEINLHRLVSCTFDFLR